MSSSSVNLIHSLVGYRLTVVERSSDTFEIYGIHNKRGFSFKLIRDPENSTSIVKTKYKIVPPTYKFTGVTSHFSYVDDELRMFRDKNLIIKIVTTLQNSGVWDILSNQEFFKVNAANRRSDHKKLSKVYLSLISNK